MPHPYPEGAEYRICSVLAPWQSIECNGEKVYISGSRITEEQKWTLEIVGGSQYAIRHIASGKYLTSDSNEDPYWITVGPKEERAHCVLEDNGRWREWKIDFTVWNHISGRVLDLSGGNTADNSPLRLNECSGTKDQIWNVKPWDERYSGQYDKKYAEKDVRITNVQSRTSAEWNGSTLYCCKSTGNDSQKWRLEKGLLGYWIKHLSSGLFLRPTGGVETTLTLGPLDGSSLEVTCDGHSGVTRLIWARDSNIVVDLANGDSRDGIPLYLWNSHRRDNQWWYVNEFKTGR